VTSSGGAAHARRGISAGSRNGCRVPEYSPRGHFSRPPEYRSKAPPCQGTGCEFEPRLPLSVRLFGRRSVARPAAVDRDPPRNVAQTGDEGHQQGARLSTRMVRTGHGAPARAPPGGVSDLSARRPAQSHRELARARPRARQAHPLRRAPRTLTSSESPAEPSSLAWEPPLCRE
jgi:hypothetical protein